MIRKVLARRVAARYLEAKCESCEHPCQCGGECQCGGTCKGKTASKNVPTDPGLWGKVQALVKGEKKSITVNGKKIDGPNGGKGFKIFPSAYANGWAARVYKELGGGWKKEASYRNRRGPKGKGTGKGGLSEWFKGHGGKEDTSEWGDWVSITPVKKTVGKKTYEPGDIVGPCGISDSPEWRDVTNEGKDPLKCMPRQKAYDMGKKERAQRAKEKYRAEKKDKDKGKKPTRTKTFKDA